MSTTPATTSASGAPLIAGINVARAIQCIYADAVSRVDFLVVDRGEGP